MTHRYAPLLLAAVITSTAAAQVYRNHSISPGVTRSHRPIDLGSGNTVYVCDRAFGYDSSRVELLWTDANQATVSAVSHRLVYPLTFLNDAVALDDGYLVAGGNVSSFNTLPFLLKTDLSGAVSWYGYFDNFGTFDQDQIVQLLSRGNAFTAYSYKGGTYDDHIYRVEGVPDGSAYTGQRIGAPAQFRMYTAMATTDPMRQLVCGTGWPNATPSNIHAMLMMHGGSGSTWMNLYDLGGDYIEDMYGLTPTSDGNYVACGYVTLGSNFFGVVMKVDPQGDVIWCRKLEDVSGGLSLTAVHELPGGDLLVCGFTAGYIGAMARLDASGMPQWTRWYNDDRLTRFAMSGSTLLACGARDRIELDANGEGCGFTNVANLTVTTITPTVLSISPTITTVTPTTTVLAAQPRVPELSMSAGCVWSGVEEPAAMERLMAYPDPTDGPLRLTGDVRAGDAVVVRNTMGQSVLRTRYDNVVDLSPLASGSYLIELERTGARIKVMRR